jgi:hypothetical protein
MNLIRLIVFGFLGLSVVYVVISMYSRSVRMEKLEKQWGEDHPDGNDEGRDAWLREGMQAYHKSFRPKLILLVYIVPIIIVVVTLITTN